MTATRRRETPPQTEAVRASVPGGGALLDIKQQQFYYAIGAPVYQGYGLTEAAPIISANTPFINKMGSSGAIMPGVTCKIMDDSSHESIPGKIGEIVIKGDN